MQLQDYVQMFRRGWWIVVLTALSALIIALLASYRTTPVYSTSARFIISPNLGQGASGATLINSISTLDKRSIASTFAEVLNSETVYNRASAELKIDPAELRTYKISTVVLPDANILELSASGTNPQTAALLANGVGRTGIGYVTQLYPIYSVEVLDPAIVSTNPISPNPRRDAGLALAVGAALGIALVVLREQLRVPLTTLRQQTSIDNVSSAYTRKYALQELETMMQRDGGEAALGIVQFDNLQTQIDALPRPALQRLLQQITTTFRDELRGRDVVGRWNDTSFVVVLPNTSGAAATKTIEQICQLLAKPLDAAQTGDTITLSPRAGVVEARGSEPVSVVVAQAEAALEQARKNGNNMPHVFSDMQTASA